MAEKGELEGSFKGRGSSKEIDHILIDIFTFESGTVLRRRGYTRAQIVMAVEAPQLRE